MSGKYGEYSEKSECSKPADEKSAEVRNIKLLYRNPSKPERDPSSRASSDDETTSSSLIPIPDSLQLMRTELKKTINDIGQHSGSENFGQTDSTQESTAIANNSFQNLRKKYTLQNEASVAMKVNSANLMLDDILSSQKFHTKSQEKHQIMYLEEELKAKTESENMSSESSDVTPKHISHVPILSHSITPVQFDLSSATCPKHCTAFQSGCGCSSLSNKGTKIDESPKGNQMKKSLLEKFHDLQIKYRIQTVYKMMQKTNPFTRSRREGYPNVEQGIPGSSFREDGVGTEEQPFCKCEAGRYPGNPYPKRMIFDLIESSDVSQSDCKSTEGEDGRYRCPVEIRCTCRSRRECNNPEIAPQCICGECTCKASERASKQNLTTQALHSQTKHDDYSQKEPKYNTYRQNSKKDDPISAPQKENSANPKLKEIQPIKKSPPVRKKPCHKENRLERKTDIYYFDHGNSAYYRTTDDHPTRYTECLVERTDEYATKFWAEIFGMLAIGLAFLVSFIIQFYRFLFTSIIRSLTVGFLQIFSDYFLKPFLTIFFNGIIQPFLILAYNVATSLRDLFLPISQIFGFFAKEIANIFRSCRLVEVNRDSCRLSSCNCENKV